jgi:hypothetical protein
MRCLKLPLFFHAFFVLSLLVVFWAHATPIPPVKDPDAETNQILADNIRRMAKAPNLVVRAEFIHYPSGSRFPIKITLSGELDDQAQRVRVVKVAHTFSYKVIDYTTIRKG